MARSPGLGRGLSALISDSASPAEGVRSASYLELPLDAIAVNPYQPRGKFDQASLNVLTESIREVGVLQPVLVRPSVDGRYELIAGERRCRAARQAGLDRIPAVVRTAEDADTLEQALLENLHREDLNAIEEAVACQQLMDEFGFTQETVAKRLGRSRSAVANTVRLLQLPDEVKDMVISGSLSAGHARALLGIVNEKRLITLAKKAVSDGLTVRMVEEAARGVAPAAQKAKRPAQRASGADRGAAVLELESLLSDHLDTKVDVTLGKGQGKLVIQFADLDDLERIYRVMLQA
ncbi:MAG: ParB/RepB/Spo0J family partition protein [bacterium]|nr:ParB/RepB/Spo0J family partition protein [bacterium]MCY3962771.1 ParB/RepB/Spo0J family partition protein [bacterium]MCY4133508.1 ParB/RepB/Spo0J family partition protein [bacterium]